MSEKTTKGLIIAAAAGLIVAAGTAIGLYAAEAGRYEEVFLPNTKINGIDASRMTVEQMKAEIEKEIEDNVLYLYPMFLISSIIVTVVFVPCLR